MGVHPTPPVRAAISWWDPAGFHVWALAVSGECCGARGWWRWLLRWSRPPPGRGRRQPPIATPARASGQGDAGGLATPATAEFVGSAPWRVRHLGRAARRGPRLRLASNGSMMNKRRMCAISRHRGCSPHWTGSDSDDDHLGAIAVGMSRHIRQNFDDGQNPEISYG